MLNIENLTTTKINSKLLEKIANSLTQRDIELTMCDNILIQQYNYKYRGINKITDVLSFPLDGEFDMMPIGSIVISIDKVKEKSMELGHNNSDEVALLFIHGLLHLLGYDHEIDNGEMRAKEEEIITLFNLPKSLIIRVEEN